jgi:hypothetical protein
MVPTAVGLVVVEETLLMKIFHTGVRRRLPEYVIQSEGSHQWIDLISHQYVPIDCHTRLNGFISDKY